MTSGPPSHAAETPPFAVPGRTAARSDAGRVRKVNEDSFGYVDEARFYVVADGMGSQGSGEVASRLAVDTMSAFIRRSADSGEFSWPYGIEPTLSFEGNRLRTAIHLANRRVYREAEGQEEYTGMATTVVSVLVSPSTAVVGHVGDSRLYAWSDTRGLALLTKDDSWAMTLLADQGPATPGRAGPAPTRNVLTNVVGAREQTTIHINEHALAGVDWLLLSTDGLHGVLTDDQIADVIARHRPELESAASALVAAALEAGSRDNVTVVLVQP